MTGDQAASAEKNPASGEKKFFTVGEANRALPYVKRILGDIQRAYQEAVALRRRLDEGADAGDGEDPNDAYERALERLDALLHELRAVGCELKDFERGLVDFPARAGGREVLLCWQQGEDSIEAWHELEGGFAGRRPVAELPPDEDADGLDSAASFSASDADS